MNLGLSVADNPIGLINRVILNDKKFSITQPMVCNYKSQKILYCTNTDNFENIDVDSLKDCTLIIVNDSVDQGAGDLRFCDYADEYHLNVIMLIGDATQQDTRSQIVYYPYWYHRAKNNFFSRNTYQKNIESISKTYKISSLNGNPRWHRIYNYLLLRDKKYFNEFLFDMHLPNVSDHKMMLDWSKPANHTIPENLLEQWYSIKDNFTDRNDIISNIRIDADIHHPAFSDSYINLVSETTVDGLFVSEKTWKPIASGQLFLIIGGRSTVAYLKDFGVDVFDDVIDHKYYDNEPDWQTRIHKIHNLIEDLLSQDLYVLNQRTQQRRLLNAEKFFNSDTDTLYQQNLVKCITTPK
jgi:hypothetical protein